MSLSHRVLLLRPALLDSLWLYNFANFSPARKWLG